MPRPSATWSSRINDFDEVHPGPWEWDVKRLAASAAVAVRFMGGGRRRGRRRPRGRCVRSYRKRIRRYAEMGYLEVWYDHIDDHAVLEALSPRVRRNAERSCSTRPAPRDTSGRSTS